MQELREIQDKQHLLLKITQLFDISNKISIAIKIIGRVIVGLTESIKQNRKCMVDFLKDTIATINISPENKRKIIKKIEDLGNEFINNHSISSQQFDDRVKEIIDSVLLKSVNTSTPSEANSNKYVTNPVTVCAFLGSNPSYVKRKNVDAEMVSALDKNNNLLGSLLNKQSILNTVIESIANSGDLDPHKLADVIQLNLGKANKCLEDLSPTIMNKIVLDVSEAASKVIDLEKNVTSMAEAELQAKEAGVTQDSSVVKSAILEDNISNKLDDFLNLDDEKVEVKQDNNAVIQRAPEKDADDNVENEESRQHVSRPGLR